MDFKTVAETFEKIESISSRNEMVAVIADFYKKSSIEDAQIFSYLIEGRVAPQFIRSEFSFAEKSLINLFDDYCRLKGLNVNVAKLRKETGDIGLTIQAVKQAVIENVSRWKSLNHNVNLTVVRLSALNVYEKLWEIVNIEGSGSVNQKGAAFMKLFEVSSDIEVKFLARIVCGKLRMGCNIKTLLDALSVCVASDKSMRELLDLAYGFISDAGYIAKLVLSPKDKQEVIAHLEGVSPVVGIPIFPRLVDRVAGFDEAYDKLDGQFYVEPKYDGVRCHIHKGVDFASKEVGQRIWVRYITFADKGEMDLFGKVGGQVPTTVGNELYSRNLENFTEMFPEVISSVEKLNCISCIIDCEIVGLSKNGFVPFQETMTRRRKYGVEGKSNVLPVKAFAFDLLSLNGEDISKLDFSRRIELLDNLIKSSENLDNIEFAPTTLVKDKVELKELFDKYVKEGYEGIVLKQPTGRYLPGVRNLEWIKLKKSLEQMHVDTFDLTILGFYHGSGKQTKFNMGALLGGVYDDESGLFEPITKIGTGITEEMWRDISSKLSDLTVKSKPISVNAGAYIEPDVWVDPKIVVTVDADEISKSHVYDVGKTVLGFGVALRFPRLIEFGRDKLAEDCTSVEEVVEMYRMRSKERKEKS